MNEVGMEWLLPIVKAERDGKKGRIRIHGIASDGSRDLQGQRVKAEGNPRCIDLINQGRAVFDFRHNSDFKNGPVVGTPEGARFINADEAKRLYPGFEFEGQPIEVWGYINELGDSDLAPDDLKHLHHYADIRQPLFMSIRTPTAWVMNQKTGGAETAIPGPIVKIALTEQPINGNTPVVLAKSIDAALRGLGDIEIEQAPYCRERPRLMLVKSALESDGELAQTGTASGDPLKLQDIGEPGGENRTCAKCGAKVAKEHKYCGACGALYKSIDGYLMDLDSMLRAA